MNLQDFTNAIEHGELDDEFAYITGRVEEAIEARKMDLVHERLSSGRPIYVEFNSKASPAYIRGHVGRITEIIQTRRKYGTEAVVKLAHQVGRIGETTRAPFSILSLVDEDTFVRMGGTIPEREVI